MKKILVLGVSCASTWMLVHELKHHFRSVHIVIEEKEPAWTFIRRRIYKLGIIPTIGTNRVCGLQQTCGGARSSYG